LLRSSPSSVKSQPWHFVIASTEKAKQKLSKSTQDGFIFNNAKVINASHVVVFCAKTQIDENYIQHILQTEESVWEFSFSRIKRTS
jgi:nitroreductase / dihydropteridine reductase